MTAYERIERAEVGRASVVDLCSLRPATRRRRFSFDVARSRYYRLSRQARLDRRRIEGRGI